VRNPNYVEMLDETELTLHRVCDHCVPELERRMTQEEVPESEVNGSINSLTAATQILEISEANSFEYDDRFLIECPVCRTDLRQFGDEDLQAIHVASCLEGHSTSPSFTGGSRHLGSFSHNLTNPSLSITRRKSSHRHGMRHLL